MIKDQAVKKFQEDGRYYARQLINKYNKYKYAILLDFYTFQSVYYSFAYNLTKYYFMTDSVFKFLILHL